MSGQRDEITPRTAALLAGCHPRTIRRWCRALLAGNDGRITYCRQTITGRYYLCRAEIERMIAGRLMQDGT